MSSAVSEDERTALVRAAGHTGRVRQWRRDQAILLLADAQTPHAVVRAVGANRSGVDTGVARWRQAGLEGLAEGPHVGLARRVDAAGALVGQHPGERAAGAGRPGAGVDGPAAAA